MSKNKEVRVRVKGTEWKCVPCEGEAHSNPFIDNCSICAPLWGEIVIPVEFVDLQDYRVWLRANPEFAMVDFLIPPALHAHNKLRKLAKARLSKLRNALRIARDRATWAEQDLARIARMRRPTDAETASARALYAAAAKAERALFGGAS